MVTAPAKATKGRTVVSLTARAWRLLRRRSGVDAWLQVLEARRRSALITWNEYAREVNDYASGN
jgi:ribosomal protein L18